LGVQEAEGGGEAALAVAANDKQLALPEVAARGGLGSIVARDCGLLGGRRRRLGWLAGWLEL